MPWLEENEIELFFNFLEPNPPLNIKGNRLVNHISFYSSEMKGVSTIMSSLKLVYEGDLDLTTIAHGRYKNTLTNLDLMYVKNGVYGLTQSGYDLYNSGLEGLDIDKYLFNSLIQKLLNNNFTNSYSKTYFNKILFELKNFYNAIPEDKIDEVLDDDNLLYFLQITYSIGDEIKRFFRLDNTKRVEALDLWNNKVRTLPTSEPISFFEKTVYKYMKSTASIQKDIRFRVQGVLKAYKEFICSNPDDIPMFDSKNNVILKESFVNAETSEIEKYKLNYKSIEIDKPFQLIVNGCPGSGKSQFLKDIAEEGTNKIIRVIFHPETTYYDFVGNYKPTPIYENTQNTYLDSSNKEIKKGKPIIDYTFVPGPFLEGYLFAKVNPEVNVILIIEEINRAKAASVFGDIFQLLDRTNGVSEYKINPSTDLKNYLFSLLGEEELSLPKNLYIWATMNSADQGVLPLDAAFKRRWEFEYLGYKTECKYTDKQITYGGTEYDWESFRNKINDFLLDKNIHEDKLIGPYFLSQKELKESKKILNKLFLYLWEDVLRFNHNELMNFKSFSELETSWNNGQGKPLNINFDA